MIFMIMDNKVPITRMNKFFSEESFQLFEKMGMELVENNMGFSFVLFSIDRTNSTDDVYGESAKDEIKTLPPVEFKGIIDTSEPTNKDYKSGIIRHLEPGNMKIYVYLKHLLELNIDIRYGDYIGYLEKEDRIRYYTVVNDGKVTSDNSHTMYGYKPFYRTVICAPTQGEFNGI